MLYAVHMRRPLHLLHLKCINFHTGQHFLSSSPFGNRAFNTITSAFSTSPSIAFIRHSRAFAPKFTRKLSTLHVCLASSSQTCTTTTYNQPETHQDIKPSTIKHTYIHNVRSNPPHHRSLPRAILPSDRPHPRQSPPTARRAGDYRRRRPDQCFLEPSMLTALTPRHRACL